MSRSSLIVHVNNPAHYVAFVGMTRYPLRTGNTCIGMKDPKEPLHCMNWLQTDLVGDSIV